MNLTIETSGISEAIAGFVKVQEWAVDLRQLGTFDWMQSEYYKVMKAHFAGEGTGKSGKWAALSPKYRALKLKKYGQMPINQRSTAMYKSISSAGGFGAVVEKKAQEMILGSTLPTAGWAHRGNKKRKRPARPIMDFTPEQIHQIVEVPLAAKGKQVVKNARLSGERGF